MNRYYEVRKSNEFGGDYHVETFNDWSKAKEYMNQIERYDRGFHYYMKETAQYYRVWASNEYFERFPIFDRIEESELETWLHENAEHNGEVWWANDRERAEFNIPYNAMGYIIKYAKI